MREIVSPEEAERRLRIIFPRAAFDTALSSPAAGMAVAAMIYIDAVCSATQDQETITWARPSTVYWMSLDTLERTSDADRIAWRNAAAKNSNYVESLYKEWGINPERKYKDNSRENLRDESFRNWYEYGVLRLKQGLPKTSPKPRWALLEDFADLFKPELDDDQLDQAAEHWRKTHLNPGAMLRAIHARDTESAEHAVHVKLPDGTKRILEPGKSSKIIKGIIESWAPARLSKPYVLAISEPGEKVHVADERTLRGLGISVDVTNILPDVIIADIDAEPVAFWIIEAVATAGPISDERRRDLLAWAAEQNIRAESCSFLTGFLSRNHSAAKKHLKDIATGTWAWFADEPGHELAWYKVVPGVDDQ